MEFVAIGLEINYLFPFLVNTKVLWRLSTPQGATKQSNASYLFFSVDFALWPDASWCWILLTSVFSI